MPKLKFTDATLRNLKAPAAGQVDFFDTLLPSFGVRVAPSGARTFFVFDRVGGKQRRMSLGRYPAVTLANARDKARAFKASAERGADPVIEAKREAAAAEARTFGKAAERFLARQKDRVAASTYRAYSAGLTGPDLAEWNGRQLVSISRADVAAALDRIDARGAKAMSNHTLAYLRLFFNDCINHDLIEHSPADRLRARHESGKRERALTRDELAIVSAALRDDDATLRVMYGVNDVPPLAALWRAFFRALMLTGQRRNEVAGMIWSEIHGMDGSAPEWELPGERTKNGLPHIVPLAPAMIELLRRRRAEEERREAARAQREKEAVRAPVYVFAGQVYGPVSGFSKAKRELDARVAALCAALGRPAVPEWTGHDLRRTMVTGMNEMGIAPHVVEAVVNHVSGAAKSGVAGVYNKALYLPERRAALAAWAAYVEKLDPTAPAA